MAVVFLLVKCVSEKPRLVYVQDPERTRFMKRSDSLHPLAWNWSKASGSYSWAFFTYPFLYLWYPFWINWMCWQQCHSSFCNARSTSLACIHPLPICKKLPHTRNRPLHGGHSKLVTWYEALIHRLRFQFCVSWVSSSLDLTGSDLVRYLIPSFRE